MSLLLNALAFLSQDTLARITGSTKKCALCGLLYGVPGIQGVAFPCGHIFGECSCCVRKVPARAATNPRKCSLANPSADLECPLCGVSAVDHSNPYQQNYTAVTALHTAEARLSRSRKLELLKALDLAGPMEVDEWEQDDEEDDESPIECSPEFHLEMDFNDVFEY